MKWLNFYSDTVVSNFYAESEDKLFDVISHIYEV